MYQTRENLVYLFHFIREISVYLLRRNETKTY
jgi:hypothetical protein